MNKTKVGFVVVVAFSSGLVLVSAGAAIAKRTDVVSDSNTNRVKPVYEHNQNGQSFGSLSDAQVDIDAPDLIAAVGKNGVRGFLRASDLLLQLPKTPEEALSMQKNAPRKRLLSLYAEDGKTVVGEYASGNIADVKLATPK